MRGGQAVYGCGVLRFFHELGWRIWIFIFIATFLVRFILAASFLFVFRFRACFMARMIGRVSHRDATRVVLGFVGGGYLILLS